jgi:HlyD family secretion protein
MYKRLRNLILLAVVVVVVVAVVATRLNVPSARAEGNVPVDETAVVERGNIALTVSATGPLRARQNVALSFPITGTVKSIPVAEGDHVLKGQTIAILETQDLLDAVLIAQSRVLNQQIALRRLTDKPRAIDVQAAEATLTLAKAQLYEAQHSGYDPLQVQIDQLNVETAKNQLWQTELQRDIDNNIKTYLQKDPRTAPQAGSLPTDNQHNAGIVQKDYAVQVAQAQLDDSKSRTNDIAGVGSAQAAVTAAQVDLDNLLKGGSAEEVAQAQAQLEAAEAALKAAKANLAKATLVAPFDGVVARLNLRVGEHTPAGPAAIMLDTHSFYVDVPVDEADISKVAVGQSANLTLDGLPGVVVNGKVTRIADSGTKRGDVVSYTVRVEIDPAGQPLLSSMSATTRIITSEVTDVLRVRNRFIRLDRATNKAYLDVLQPDGSYKEVEITLGLRNDTYTEVKSGVQAGETIAILENNNALRPPSR